MITAINEHIFQIEARLKQDLQLIEQSLSVVSEAASGYMSNNILVQGVNEMSDFIKEQTLGIIQINEVVIQRLRV